MGSRKDRRQIDSSRIFTFATLLLLTGLILGVIAFTHSRKATAGPPSPPAEAAALLPTIANRSPAPGAPPEGMLWIPAGEFSMGIRAPRRRPNGRPGSRSS